MTLPSASAGNQSWYQLQAELLQFHSSHFSQTGIATLDELKINAA